MDALEIVNSHLPESREPLATLSEPSRLGREVLKVLIEHVSPDMIAETIRDMIRATRPTKHGEVADTRTQEAGVKLWLAYAVGLPVQRQEIHQTVTNRSEDDNMRLLESPAVRSMLKKMLEQAEGEEEGGTK